MRIIHSLYESENLTDEQSAERIAEHFAEISHEFSPLNINLLPQRVKTKLETKSCPPTVEDFEVYNKIISTKKPHSCVPGDLPRQVAIDFAPELAKPVSKIINSIIKSGQWPSQWQLEFVTAIGKVPFPETEDDLRPISLTNFFVSPGSLIKISSPFTHLL